MGLDRAALGGGPQRLPRPPLDAAFVGAVLRGRTREPPNDPQILPRWLEPGIQGTGLFDRRLRPVVRRLPIADFGRRQLRTDDGLEVDEVFVEADLEDAVDVVAGLVGR